MLNVTYIVWCNFKRHYGVCSLARVAHRCATYPVHDNLEVASSLRVRMYILGETARLLLLTEAGYFHTLNHRLVRSVDLYLKHLYNSLQVSGSTGAAR